MAATTSPTIRDSDRLLGRIRATHVAIRDAVLLACEQASMEQLSEIVAQEAGDTIFALDRVSEAVLLEHFSELAREWSCVLVAEGLGKTGQSALPEGIDPEVVELRIIVDPIDGTRALMYQKRSAWVLTGVAPNYGHERSKGITLADIELAVQTEIPTLKQHLTDTLWAIAGQGVGGERLNRLTGEKQPLRPTPSKADSIAYGYGGLVRYFPGARAELAAIDDEIVERLLGPIQPGKALTIEDQYVSSAGQLYELMMGHDRWVADLRPLAERVLQQRGLSLGLCCHPYDVCTELIARQAGVIVTDERGEQLRAPLEVDYDVTWVGCANEGIYGQVMPVLHDVLLEHGLAHPGS
jgi:fructose-1,6-bisphosphatase/inositol monophosphatase family enzyme